MSGPVSFCDLSAGYAAHAGEVEGALLRVARSGRYVLGAELAAFEQEFATFCGASWSVGVGSGTDALALSLRAAGVGPGDEVIVPAYTAAATWMAVAHAGARPVGVDVDPRTGLIDTAAAASAVGPATAAIVAVDLFGRLSPLDELRPVADRHRLLLVEDAAHAAGVRQQGWGPPGSGAADVVAFSFYPTKPLACLGDGGAVATDRADLAKEVRRLRSYGWSQWNGQAPSPESTPGSTRFRLPFCAGAWQRCRRRTSGYEPWAGSTVDSWRRVPACRSRRPRARSRPGTSSWSGIQTVTGCARSCRVEGSAPPCTTTPFRLVWTRSPAPAGAPFPPRKPWPPGRSACRSTRG